MTVADQTIDIARHNYSRYRNYPGDVPEHGRRASHYRRKLAAAIDGFRTAEQAILYGQTQCSFDHRAPQDYLSGPARRLKALLRGRVGGAIARRVLPKDEFELYENLLDYEYPHFAEFIPQFSESEHSWRRSRRRFRGRYVSNIMYFHMFYLFTCLTLVREAESICEIGGGYGGPARLWMLNPIAPPRRYLILDLAEALFFAEVFLRRTLPGVDIVYLHEEVDPATLDGDGRSVILCPLQNHALTAGFAFDLITATGSVQECPEDWIDFYRDWLSRQQAKRFYSHNYFANRVEDLFEGENLLSPRVPEDWRLVYARSNNPVAMAQLRRRNHAELLFEKVPADQRIAIDVDAAFKAREHDVFGLNEFAYFTYALLQHGSPEAMLRFIRKILHDLRFVPKELLYLIDRMLGLAGTNQLSPSEEEWLRGLQGELANRYGSLSKGLIW